MHIIPRLVMLLISVHLCASFVRASLVQVLAVFLNSDSAVDQDTCLKGRIGFDMKEKIVSYRAQCPIPVPGFGSVELYADYNFSSGSTRRYSYGISLATSKMLSMLHKGEADVTIKSPLNSRIGFEVRWLREKKVELTNHSFCSWIYCMKG